MSAAARREHAGAGARAVRRTIGAVSALLGALGLGALGFVVVAAPGEVGWADGGLGVALCAATCAAGVGLWRGARWGGPLALALWGAQVVQIAVGAWAWRWALGPYVHLRFGPDGAQGTAWGVGLHADLRPAASLTDYVAVNLVALGVVVVLSVALRKERRSFR